MNFDIASLPLPVRITPASPMSDEELLSFSGANHSLRIERESDGDLTIMTPTLVGTGRMNQRIGRLLDEWAEVDGRGFTADSSTGFRLPNSAVLSPDASWISNETWDALTEAEQNAFGVCPEFVIELASKTDRVANVQRKMTEKWMRSGVQLGWLIDPKTRSVTIYRPGEEPEVMHDPTSVQGTGPVSGFELVMSRVWGAS